MKLLHFHPSTGGSAVRAINEDQVLPAFLRTLNDEDEIVKRVRGASRREVERLISEYRPAARFGIASDTCMCLCRNPVT